MQETMVRENGYVNFWLIKVLDVPMAVSSIQLKRAVGYPGMFHIATPLHIPKKCKRCDKMSDPPPEETRKRAFSKQGEAVRETRGDPRTKQVEEESIDENVEIDQPPTSDGRSDDSQSCRKQMRFTEPPTPEKNDGEASCSAILPLPTKLPLPKKKNKGVNAIKVASAPICVDELEEIERQRFKDKNERPRKRALRVPNKWFFVLQPLEKEALKDCKLVYYHADYSFRYRPLYTKKKIFYSSVVVPCVNIAPQGPHQSISPLAFFDPGHRPSYVTEAFLNKYQSLMTELIEEDAPKLNNGIPGIVLNYRHPKYQETRDHPFLLNLNFIKSDGKPTETVEVKVLVVKRINRFSEVIFFGADHCEEMNVSILELGKKLQGKIKGMIFDTPITSWCSMILRILYDPEEANLTLDVSDQMKRMLFRKYETTAGREEYVNHIRSGVTDVMKDSRKWQHYFGDYIHEYEKLLQLALPDDKWPLLSYLDETFPYTGVGLHIRL